MKRPRLKCSSDLAVKGKHEWAEDIETKGKVGAYLRLNGWRQCVNCKALINYRRYKKRLKKWKARHE